MAHFKYPPSWYDENLHLKVSAFLWLIIFWSSHHTVFLGLALFANSGEISRTAVDYAYNVPSLMSNIPGVLLLIAAVNRSPSAGGRIRLIWRNGTVLLAVGMGMQIGALLALQWKKLLEFDELILASLCLSAAFLVVVLSSEHIKDVFADFPVAEEAKKG